MNSIRSYAATCRNALQPLKTMGYRGVQKTLLNIGWQYPVQQFEQALYRVVDQADDELHMEPALLAIRQSSASSKNQYSLNCHQSIIALSKREPEAKLNTEMNL